MRIDELNTRHNTSSVTVTFDPSEVCMIANALYELQSIEGHDTDRNKEAYAKMALLFDLTKGGHVEDLTVKHLMEVIEIKRRTKNG